METEDQGLEFLQLAEDQGAVRPGAGERDIKMVPTGLGPEAARATRARRAVRGDPVAELRSCALEMALPFLCIVPDVVPDTVNQRATLLCPLEILSKNLTWKIRRAHRNIETANDEQCVTEHDLEGAKRFSG